MARILAIDYGQKRTGLAVTDPLQLIANGMETVNSAELLVFLKDYFTRENVEMVVIGYPKQLNNTASAAVKFVNEFIKKFKKNFPERNFVLFDERFTSKMAFQTMIDGGLTKKKRRDKSLVDKISATILLQSYLEYKNTNT